MDKKVKRYIFSGILVTVSFLLLVLINQLRGIYIMASVLHPTFGLLITSMFFIIFTSALVFPIFSILRLNKKIELSEKNEDSYEKYLEKIKSRLVKNKYILESGFSFDDNQDLDKQVEEAIKILDDRATELIKQSSNSAFVSTAVSQNGNLDALSMLVILTKLIWNISYIYNQKPNFKEIGIIYMNVIAIVFSAKKMEEMLNFEEQLEPIIGTIVGGSISNLIPGVTAISNLIITSLLQGSANAFLTLKVGIISREYSTFKLEINMEKEKNKIKKIASLQACKLLRVVVKENSINIVKTFAKATKKATVDKGLSTVKKGVENSIEGIKDGSIKTVESIKSTTSNIGESIKSTTSNIGESIKSTTSNIGESIKNTSSNKFVKVPNKDIELRSEVVELQEEIIVKKSLFKDKFAFKKSNKSNIS